MNVNQFMPKILIVDDNAANVLKRSSTLPIIMISAENEKEYYEQALSKGVVDFITKPFNYNDIILKIKNALQLP